MPDSRTFRFDYSATIDKLKPGTVARVWVPLAPSTREQEVEATEIRVPGEYRRTKAKKFGNEFVYFSAPANKEGRLPIEISYRVTRRAVRPEGTLADDAMEAAFLGESKFVPVNDVILTRFFVTGAPKGAPRDVARQLYDRVDDHMKYDKTGEGWGRGDVLWACQSGRGNCTDFHSLFISMCRDLKIPAKFEMGFPIPTDKASGEIPGYHCWARFLADDRWVGVDISEADKHPENKDLFFGTLPADRILFTTERDLVLEPPQAGEPVNFSIYPYVEVDGQPHTSQTRKFSYADVK